MVTWWNPISFSPGSLHFRSVSTSGGGGTAYFPQITKQTFLPINSSYAPHLNICQEIRASSVKLNSTVLLFKPCISSSVLSQYVTHSSAQIIRNYCWLLPAMTFFFLQWLSTFIHVFQTLPWKLSKSCHSFEIILLVKLGLISKFLATLLGCSVVIPISIFGFSLLHQLCAVEHSLFIKLHNYTALTYTRKTLTLDKPSQLASPQHCQDWWSLPEIKKKNYDFSNLVSLSVSKL